MIVGINCFFIKKYRSMIKKKKKPRKYQQAISVFRQRKTGMGVPSVTILGFYFGGFFGAEICVTLYSILLNLGYKNWPS